MPTMNCGPFLLQNGVPCCPRHRPMLDRLWRPERPLEEQQYNNHYIITSLLRSECRDLPCWPQCEPNPN
jgi:hypothetical protein